MRKKEVVEFIEVIEEVLGKKKEKIELLNQLQNLNKALEDLVNPQLNDAEYNKGERIGLEKDWIYEELEKYKDIKITDEDIARYDKLLEFKLKLNKLEREELENLKDMNNVFGEDSIRSYSN